MIEKLKLFGVLIVFFLIAAVVYILTFSFVNFGAREKTVVFINGQEIKVEIVDSPLAQARGLSGRDSIAENEGMLFIFKEPAIQRFWMKNMKFPIDIIWIKEGRIVGFEENVQPEFGISEENLKIYSSPEPVDKVLEMKAGSVQRLGISLGNKVEF